MEMVEVLRKRTDFNLKFDNNKILEIFGPVDYVQ